MYPPRTLDAALRRWLAGACLTMVAGSVGAGPASAQPGSPAAGCRDRLTAAAVAAGVRPATITEALRDFTPDSSVLVARQRQPEFVTPIWDYLAFLVDEERIADGRERLTIWADALEQAEQRFGVDRHTIVAVWGIESDYGRVLGQRPLVRSLATEACHGTRRAFAAEQFVATLRILDTGELTADQLRGSWAGAFGQTQFMPTTFLSTAVDLDGDGRRDIVGSVPDALGSTARFLQRAGWKTGARWGYEVKVPNPYRGPSGRTARRSVADWTKAGVRRLDGRVIVASGPAALLFPAGKRGPAFLVFANYDAIYSYNAAQSYALAIGLLANRLRGEVGLVREWPTADRGLSRAERREVQERLAAKGWYTGPADGVLGQQTRDAIRRFQAAVGLPVDGRAGGGVLDSLRARTSR
ncbi:MAG: lytic murein transglycosylase [Gemmatimonadales bacterium]